MEEKENVEQSYRVARIATTVSLSDRENQNVNSER